MNALATTLLTLVLVCPAVAGGQPAYWNEDLSDVQAVTGTPAGAMATSRSGGKERTSAIRFRLSPEAEYRVLVVKGQVRSLVYIDDGDALLAVVQKQGKRRSWDTYLLRIDTSNSKAERMVTLPRTAAGMTIWPGARHLLVACDQEIRSFTLPDFRSGPLYQLPGGNLALAHHSGPLFLVGRTLDLVLVNLEDPQGDTQIPVRQRFSIANPLRTMTISPDATRLYGVTLDGKQVEQSLDVLDLSAALMPVVTTPGPDIVTAPGPAPVKPVEPSPVAKPQPREAVPPPAVEKPKPEPEPAPVAKPEVQETAVPPAVEKPKPEPEPVPVTKLESQETVTPPAVEKPKPEFRRSEFQLSGRVEGPAAAQVEWVLILGPDSILREQTRVRLEQDGRWGVDSLPPGRYRLVLDGGGGRAIVSVPRFATVEVNEGQAVEVPTFDAQRVR